MEERDRNDLITAALGVGAAASLAGGLCCAMRQPTDKRERAVNMALSTCFALSGGICAGLAARRVQKSVYASVGKPEGIAGGVVLQGMNLSHSKMADWSLSQLAIPAPAEILEAGCGGGRNIAALLERYPDAIITGVDYAPLSVETARRRNRTAVEDGRAEILEADVRDLNALDDGRFDLATAFETIYFWPDLTACFREIGRVLKPGGTFLIGNETAGEDEAALRREDRIENMICYTEDQITEALREAGFTAIETARRGDRPWIAVLARKEWSGVA